MALPHLLLILFLAYFAKGDESARIKRDIWDDCQSSENMFLKRNHWYSYEVHILGNTALVGTSDQYAQLDIRCPVKVQHSTKCAYTLEFDSTCSIKATSGNNDDRKAWFDESSLTQFSDHPIAFTVIDGAAHDVFAHPDDSVHVVNLKKGVISALLLGNQIPSREPTTKEIRDVQGKCPLTLQIKNNKHVHASKDLSLCVSPEKPMKQDNPFSVFWYTDFVKYMINYTFECDSTLEDGVPVMKKMLCTERYGLKPDSSYNTKYGSVALISYEYILQGSGQSTSISPLQVQNLKHSGIEYVYEDPLAAYDGKGNPEEASQLLQKLISEDKVTLDSIPEFLDLVERMRNLEDLQTITTEVEKCSDGKSDCSRKQRGIPMYLDALVQCNRLPCIREFRKLHTKKFVKKSLLELTLFSWLRMSIRDHRYFPEILEICKESQNRFCNLALGGLVKSYNRDHNELPDEVRAVVTYYSSILGTSCGPKEVTFPSGTSLDQRNNFVITTLKTLGNMGNAALKVEPELLAKLLACAKNSDNPESVQYAAIEALEQMHPELSSKVTNELTSILANQSLPLILRIESFKLLVIFSKENEQLAEQMAEILKVDPSKQLKAYMASFLTKLGELPGFPALLIKHLTDKGVNVGDLSDLDWQTTSHLTLREDTSVLPRGYLPEELSTFGHHLITETIYNGWSAIPAAITANLNLTLFGQAFEFMEVGIKTAGLDALAVRSYATLESLLKSGNTNAMQYVTFILQQLSQRKPTPGKKAQTPALLNVNWEDNIQKIVDAYQTSHEGKLRQHVLLYLKMFGVDLDFTTLEDVVGGIQRLLQRMNQRGRPSKASTPDIPFSRSHIINFAEADYVCPTFSGILYKLRSYFTVGVSLDANLDINMKHQKGSMHFKPTLAAINLNKMLLSLPGVTELGAQSVSSLYSSSQWDAEGSGSPIKISLLAPKEKQRLFELYRTNSLIAGSKVTELEDWDAERVDHNHCLGETFVKAMGMKVCVQSSHLNVRHRNDKPFYYLAGRASWVLSVEMEDRGIKAYTMGVDFTRRPKLETKLDINANAKGSLLRREVPLRVLLNEATGEFSLDLKHSEFPEFSLTANRNRIKDGDKNVGYKSEILLKDTQLLWNLLYEKTSKNEVREDKPMTRNEPPSSEKHIETQVEEKSVNLKTLYNDYAFILKLHQHPSGNLKVDSKLSYQNLDPTHNWLARIIPDIFYEAGNRKAWMEFRGDWKFGHPKPKKGHHDHGGHQHHHPGGHHRESKSHLTIPATVIEVLTHHMQKPKHSMMCVNISKVERSTGNLLLFANLTYNVWKKGQEGHRGDEIRSANFTLARHSWNLEVRTEGNLYSAAEAAASRIYVFTGEKMIPKDPERDGKYIGWWNPESASRFDSRRWHATYRQHLRRKTVDESDLPSDSRNEIKEDISSEEDDGHSSEEEEYFISSQAIRNEAIHADVSLEYPYDDKQENLTFKGTFQWNGRRAPSYRTFLKTFTMASTLHALQLDSQSIWTKAGNEKLVLSHHSAITGTQSQKNHGVYNLLFRKQLVSKCVNVHLNHSISAHWLNFASHVIGTCKPGKPTARQYDIFVEADHTYWKDLNYKVEQKIDLDKPGGESMNLTSSTMDIKVKGDWNNEYYKKDAEFNSKTDLMPSTRWELAWNRKDELSVDLLAPGQPVELIRMTRSLHNHNKEVVYRVGHSQKLTDETLENDFIGIGKITNSRTIEVDMEWKPELGVYMTRWLARFLHQTSQRFFSKLGDPEHELNKNLKETLKGKTVLQYLSALHKKASKRVGICLRDFVEIVQTFESFYGPSFRIVGNTVNELVEASKEANHHLANTDLGWAWKYFEVEKHAFTFIEGMQRRRTSAYQKGVLHRTINHPFIMNKFNEVPKIDPRRDDEDEEVPFPTPSKSHHEKVALLFGPSHVLTFDGRVLSVPSYPNEKCVVLLAQDVRGKSFSALCNHDSFFLIFPEMSVTINGSGRVYINNSRDESSTPVFSDNKRIIVSRLGNIVKVESPFLDVDCDTNNELCVLVLSPLMTGGVIGLLGNADGEKHNELMGTDNNLVSSVSELSALYEVSGEAGCKNFVESPQPPIEDAKVTKACDELLKSENVRQCLETIGVDEADLRGPCVSDFHRENCPCATSKGITALCSYEGYELDRCKWMRRPAGSKPVPNQHDSWLIRGTHQLQMVLVVEDNKEVLGGGSVQALKGLETFLANVEDTFTSSGGFTSVTYSLVSYGGDGGDAHPRMHTQHRLAWMLQRDLLKSIKEMSFASSSRGDPITAVEFATTVIPFDPASTKIFLVIALDDSPDASKRGFSHVHDVQTNLDRHGAALYVVASYPWLEHGKKVFGLRADGLIFPNDGDDSYGDFPRMPCAKMAAGTRGSIFWRSFMEGNKNPFYYESLSSEMLARVQNESGKCRQCVCAMNHWWQRHTYCRPAPPHLQTC